MQRFLPEPAIQLRAKTDIPGLYLTGKKNKALSSVLFVITIKKLSFQCKVHVFANLQKPTNSV